MKNVLIYNRGEIAARAVKEAIASGLKPIVILCESERNLDMASYAEVIIVNDSQNPYMNLNFLEMEFKKKTYHFLYPGYGFLSEDKRLARLCEKYNVSFMGPSPTVLEKLSSKKESLNFAKAVGLKVLEYEKGEKLEYPLMLKASMGGGGRGNSVVDSEAELGEKLEALKKKSLLLFNDNEIMKERFLPTARHVEVQFVASKTEVKLLSTRDCSLQLRFQKIMEEGPSCAESLARVLSFENEIKKEFLKLGYIGVGTIEFLWDTDKKELYFLEVNTRIQVEHPVTEAIYQNEVNLVKIQFDIALGLELKLSSLSSGYGMCARVYAVDPTDDFSPSVGVIHHFQLPSGARFDSHLRQGDEISALYDPLIGKLIISGLSRKECISLMKKSLRGMHVHGVKTNIPFLIELLENKDFVANNHHISWVEEILKKEISDIDHTYIIESVKKDLVSDSEVNTFEYRDFYRKKYLR